MTDLGTSLKALRSRISFQTMMIEMSALEISETFKQALLGRIVDIGESNPEESKKLSAFVDYVDKYAGEVLGV